RAAPTAHRLERRALRTRLAAQRWPAGRDRLLPRPLVRAASGRPRGRARHRRVRRALRHRRRARERLRRAVPPREVLERRAEPARELQRGVRPGTCGGMILYPAIDIRAGRAVRLAQGDFAAETVYDADPL